MIRIATMRRRRLLPASLLLAPLLTACMSWQASMLGSRESIIAHGHEGVRVTRSDGTRIQLRNPWVKGDSVVVAEGLWRVALPRRPGAQRTRWLLYEGTVAIPLDDIVVVEERRLSVAATAAASTAGLVVAAGWLVMRAYGRGLAPRSPRSGSSPLQ